VLPGPVELHTDNLEKHVLPRPQVRWPMRAAVLAHDAELAAAGITTVLNGITMGAVLANSLRHQMIDDCVQTLTQARAEGLTRADHYVHFRCEVSAPNVLTAVNKHRDLDHLRLISVMDHTPGQRQWTDIDKYRARVRKLEQLDDAQIDALIQRRLQDQGHYATPNEHAILKWAQCRGIPLASHDDATAEHVINATKKGIRIAEFPTTMAAASAARQMGMLIVMGAPNLLLGGSHSGNVAAVQLARDGLLDVLSSDYVPMSLLAGAMQLHNQVGWSLPEAIATVTASPAQAVGLEDRGVIEIGKRADLLRVALRNQTPIIRSVWRSGQRVV
jgi:alpha-D-ribose 1-methylphosphonate 5-triphosphate diphosphatase